ncbi:MAG: C_GCAxxG_C_C family protein [Deltaproteobacteria bacterium]|nr:C_GCAxxG_C_C family protein [Deltaproteobacteria bacterium]MBW1919485.1 C_GCAxxG_C_C family protein [Deltaproteobacteria bacterium]MBW1934786.1 C_GCAxxG_C_C family protein [Deltaproteobacteria bacterium]
MTDYEALRRRVEELEQRTWDTQAIKDRVDKLAKEGIPKKILKREEVVSNKKQILDRVQRRAEEYNFILKNCAQGTALALMEEFGLGNMEIIKALTPFPGIGGTGEMCGGVTGSLITFGLYFGSNDALDSESHAPVIMRAQKFMALFEDELGHLLCSEIQEHVIFGRNMDPGGGEEKMKAFAQAKGFEKCGLAPGIGARLSAEFIISSMA